MVDAAPSASAPFAIDSALDVAHIRAAFDREQRLSIDNFLIRPAVKQLRSHLAASDRWRHVINGAERVFEIPSDALLDLPDTDKDKLERAIMREAAAGFQLPCDTIRVAHEAVEAVVPNFNMPSLFAVGQPHRVIYVAPYAPENCSKKHFALLRARPSSTAAITRSRKS